MGLHCSAVVAFASDVNDDRYKYYDDLDLKVEVVRRASDNTYIPHNKSFAPSETPYLKVFTGSDIEIAHIETVFGSSVAYVGEGVEQVSYALEFGLSQFEADILMDKGENPVNKATIPDIVTNYKVLSSAKQLGMIIKTGVSEFTASKIGWGYASILYSTDVKYFMVTPSKEAREKNFTEQIKLFGKLRDGLLN